MIWVIVLVLICCVIVSFGGRNRGQCGENKIYDTLEKLSGCKAMLPNCYLPTENGDVTEVDLILIHESGIYVVESKTTAVGYSEVRIRDIGRKAFLMEKAAAKSINFITRFGRMIRI